MIEQSTARVVNFNAGPAAMPQVVLERMQAEMLDIRGQVAYADTGYWSHTAMDSARALSRVNEVVHCQKEPLIKVPDSDQWADCESASFLHVTDNETIDGIVLHEVADRGVPLVCDLSSSILSQPVDIKRYGMIYAGAQKNIGPAGITLVIVKDELLDLSAEKSLPPVFSYAAIAKAGAMLNTPPTCAWYASGLVFLWLLDEGGLRASLYNAVTDRAIDALVDYLNSFAEQHA